MQSQSSSPEASVALCARPRQYGGSLAILAGPPDHGMLAESLARLAQESVELSSPYHRSASRRRGARSLSGDRFDLSYHMRWETLGGDAALFPIAARRLCEPLDESRPLWELHVLEGPTRTQVLVKLDPDLQEHLGTRGILPRLVQAACGERLGSGRATAASFGTLRETFEMVRSSAVALSESAGSLAAAAREAIGAPSELATSALKTARSLGIALTERLTDPPSGPFSDLRNDRRSFALVDLPLSAFDAVRASLGLGLEALLLSITSGALARLERELHGSIPHALRALVALPWRPQAGILLPLDESDPLERAAHIGDTLATLASTPHLPTPDGVAGLFTALPRALARLGSGASADCSVSLRYECEPLAGGTLAGAKVLRVYPFNGTRDSMSLSIGAQPYGRWLGLGLSCDPSAVDPPRRLVDAIRDSAAELASAAGGPSL